MNDRILITGSSGLIGRALRGALEERGTDVVGLDPLGVNSEKGDVRNPEQVAKAVSRCSGVVHLAAVSRVVWGQSNPSKCWDVNVGGLTNVLEAIERKEKPPWLIFGSSREVYGQPEILPVTEDAPLRPINVYGHSKVKGEYIVQKAQARGLRAGIIRFSNVYGNINDHHDRVIPAFIKAALSGDNLQVEGVKHTFDFTHIEDTIRGIVNLIDLIASSEQILPPLHLVTGIPQSLTELATTIIQLADGNSSVIQSPPRSFDIDYFYGNPERAHKLLGWTPRVSLREGLERLIEDYRNKNSFSPSAMIAER